MRDTKAESDYVTNDNVLSTNSARPVEEPEANCFDEAAAERFEKESSLLNIDDDAIDPVTVYRI